MDWKRGSFSLVTRQESATRAQHVLKRSIVVFDFGVWDAEPERKGSTRSIQRMVRTDASREE
eukprot:1232041-Rhodomonas_salina.2